MGSQERTREGEGCRSRIPNVFTYRLMPWRGMQLHIVLAAMELHPSQDTPAMTKVDQRSDAVSTGGEGKLSHFRDLDVIYASEKFVYEADVEIPGADC